MKFDAVIGNPPYQEEIEGRRTQPAIYNKFMDASYSISDKVCLITPARFLFNTGSTSKAWNKKMLGDKHLKVLFYEQNSATIFANTDIKGGVAITYRDANQDYGAIDVFVAHDELKDILNKVPVDENLSSILHSSTSYKYASDIFERHPEFDKRLKGGARKYAGSPVFDVLPEIFLDDKPDTSGDYIRILGRQNNTRTYKYVMRDYFQPHQNLDKYKVIVPGANGSGVLGEELSSPLIGTPGVGHTQTFISFGAFDTLEEADGLLKYIKSKFARTMLGILKITQSNTNKETWSKVPLQDFTSDSDIDWTQSIADIDQQLYKKYGLSEEEIEFIETKVKEMD